ncbi:N-acetylmuramoyl-L-alanine amidase family protein, partial [Clostridium neonatale]|uniref:N-acetylmuramoyl-L-alanine amidase family protein n=1 Tax=Clostridium neonatale TaxID=137838 RepID=UPI003D34A2CD
MFRRSTKITSLIVAAASVATMVPAMAADTAKVSEKDGTVYHAVAYKDGTFYIDGDIDDKGEGAFYLENGKYSELEDIDSGSEAELYSDKYVNVDSGDYYVDLSNGKVNDEDDLVEDAKDDAQTALEKKIKKDEPDDRYALDTTNNKPKAEYQDTVSASYTEDWYEYKVDAKAGGTYTVYTDVNGNYIDADYDLGKIKLVTGDSVATIENTKDTVKANGAKYGVKLNHVETIAQDKDYIYRIATIQIYNDVDGVLVAEDTEKAPLFFGGKNDRVGVYTDKDGKIKVIQKISKAQNSDEVDDAKYPKTTETYFQFEYKDFDSKGKAAGAKNPLANDGFKDQWTVANGSLVNYGYNDSDEKVKAITFNLKTKAGFNYIDTSDSDFEYDDIDADAGIKTDKDGNVWVLSDGKVRTYKTSGSWETPYKVDGAMEALSVYDKDNLIAWNEDEEVYCIVGGKSSTDDKEEEVPAVTTGWAQDATTGAWSYTKADGTKAIGWFQSPTSGLW